MKKKISIVLSVILMVILLLTCVTSTAYGYVWPAIEYKLEMTAYSKSLHACGPSSGVSIGRYYRDEVDRDGDEGDVIIEDFEWGDNGTSLGVEPPLGDVDWTLNMMGGWWGNSVAEISTEYARSDDKSARFYRGDTGPGYIQAHYSQAPPTSRKFYFYFEEGSDTVLYTTNGDGDNRIYVRVSLDDEDLLVEYYDGDNWQPGLLVDYPCWIDKWHDLEFKNIDWLHATYDIKCDGITCVAGADMKETPSGEYNGMTAYYNMGAMGSECWIDDIIDTRTGADYYYLPDDEEMFERLYDCMGTTGTYPEGSTTPSKYGPGFAEMTLDPDGDPDIDDGYDNFGYVNDFDLTNLDDFWAIKDAIDKGWPVALCGNFKDVDEISGDPPGGEDWPPDKDHYIAIRGYGYYALMSYTWGHYIICTDSYCNADELKINWNNLINNGIRLKTTIIRDDVIENFEWGSDTVSLSTDGGDVDWTVSTGGSSYAQIDDDVSHLGTRSAKIYRDGSNSVYARYSLYHPEYVGFYIRKDGSAYSYFLNGDGTKRIIVRITSGEMLQYYDTAYRDVCTVSAYAWHLIEFRDINWSAYTYDIYIDGDMKADNVGMQTYSGSNGNMYYGSSAGSGNFWVDAIFE